MYAIGVRYQPGKGDTKYFLKRTTNSLWIPVDSVKSGEYQRFGVKIWTSPSGKLYSASNYGIFRWNGQVWQLMENVGFGSGGILFGSSDENIFLVTGNGLYHYNGIDWHLNQDAIFTMKDTWSYTAGWTDGKEAFIAAHTLNFPQQTLVLHGK
jgi:hypothetical protein